MDSDFTKLWRGTFKLLGEPIDTALPVPMPLNLVCNIDTVAPGQDLYKFESLETTADEIKTIDANGVITATKVTLKDKTQVSFTTLTTDKYYVEIDELWGSPDQKIFERKRKALIRAMDKIEVRLLMNLILNDSDVATISITSGYDLYDVIMDGIQTLDDYGDQLVLLAGSTVHNSIALYDKRKADNFNYSVNLPEKLASLNVEVKKMFGYVKYTGDESKQRLLSASKFIMVARNSTIEEGQLPLWFVRRRIDGNLASLMNANVDKAQRALFIDPAPTQKTNTEIMAFGVLALESIALVNTNYKSMVKSADLSSIIGANLT